MLTPITAKDLLAAPWRVCEERPGVVFADLGKPHGSPWLLVVDDPSELSDADAAAVAAHVVELHNAVIAPFTRHIDIRVNQPDPGDAEWVEATRDGTGRIVKLVHGDEAVELDARRYQPIRWVKTTYTWRPRLRLYDRETRHNDLYPGKPDHVTRDRVDSIPAELLAAIVHRE